MSNNDPTRQEMVDFLRNTNFTWAYDADKFDIEEAIYWFAHDYHSGQWSNLYSAPRALGRPSFIASTP